MGTGLKSVYLPASLTYIAPDAFEGPDSVTVTVEKDGCYAYNWAVQNGYLKGPKITAQPVNAAIATGRDVTNRWFCDDFSFSVTATGASAYQWEYSEDKGNTWYEVRGERKRVFSGTPTRAALQYPYYYRCKVTGPDGWIYTNVVRCVNSAKIKIAEQPQIELHYNSNYGSDWRVLVEATVKAMNAEAYQWQISDDEGKTWSNVGERVTGFLGARYYELLNQLPENRRYRCKVTGVEGDTVYSNYTTPSSPHPVNFYTQPTDQLAASGESVTFAISAWGSTSMTYQWQSSADGSAWSDFTKGSCNAQKLTFTAAAGDLKRFYRCKVTNGSLTAYSQRARLYGYGISGNAKITQQPEGKTVTDGMPVKLTVKATGASDYIWQRQIWGEWQEEYIPQGRARNTITATVTAGTDGDEYRCVVLGSDGVAVISDVATIRANRTENKPFITQQPVDFTDGVYGGTDTAEASFEIRAENASSYQWQISEDGGASWSNATEKGQPATYNSYIATSKVSLADLKKNRYRCKVTGPTGLTTYSNAVRVATGDVQIVLQYSDRGAAYVGQERTFRATVVSYIGRPASFQWQRSGDGGATWRDMPCKVIEQYAYQLTKVDTCDKAVVDAYICVTPENIGTKCRCVATLQDGTVKTSEAVSVVLDVDRNGTHMSSPIYEPISYTAQPADQQASIGDTVKFTMKATNVYCWCWQSSTDGKTWKLVPGSSGYYRGPSEEKGVYTLSVKATESNLDNTLYRCRLMCWGGYVFSSESVRIIGKQARITVQPTDQQVAAGETATFWVRAAHASAYQWQSSDDGKTWSNLSGEAAKQDRYSVTASASLIGKKRYRCAITGPDGKKAYSAAVTMVSKTSGHSHSWQAITERQFVMDAAGYEYRVSSNCNCGYPIRDMDDFYDHLEDGKILIGDQLIRSWNTFWDGEEGLREPLHPHMGNWGGPTGPTLYEPMAAHFKTVTVGYRCSCGMTKPK